MSHHEDLPGVVPASGPDATLEWVRPEVGIVGALAARLGSDPRGEELLAAVMRTLRGRLPGDTWEALLDELPFSTRALLRSDATAGVAPDTGAEPIAAVAKAMMHPRPRARLEVIAVFASLKLGLPRGIVDAVSSELPGELGALWREAR